MDGFQFSRRPHKRYGVKKITNQVDISNYSSAGLLLSHAKKKRLVDSFNDVTIKVANFSVRANKLVLTCFSKYFDSKFQQEKNVVEIHGFDFETISMLIDYMYGEKITINQNNVFELLPAAHHLQMETVTKACLTFLLNLMATNVKHTTVGNKTTLTSSLPDEQQNQIGKYIGEYFHAVVRMQDFKALSTDQLLLVLQITQTTPESMFFVITDWCTGSSSRKSDFDKLFSLINLCKTSSKFLEDRVLQHSLVTESTECLNLVKLELCRKLKQVRLSERKETDSKILCVGGDKQCTVSDIHSLFGKADYPQLPYSNLSGHCAEKVDDFVYCTGGTTTMDKKFQSTERIFRMNINEKTWIEVAPLQERRSLDAAAIYKGKLVVAGGNDFNRVLSTVELYDHELNNWISLGGLRCARSAHAMAACDNYILAIGGDLSLVGMDALSTVEKLSGLDGDWNYVASMSVGRK